MNNYLCFCFRAAVFNRLDLISFLLDHGVPIDTRDAQSSTPFLDAVAAGQTKCARLLLQRGADIKASDIFMKNCIHMAVENENLETLQMLLEERSVLWNLYRPDVHERVPLHYAAMVKDIKVGNKRKYGFVFCIWSSSLSSTPDTAEQNWRTVFTTAISLNQKRTFAKQIPMNFNFFQLKIINN